MSYLVVKVHFFCIAEPPLIKGTLLKRPLKLICHPAIFTPLKINRIVLFPHFVTLFRSLVLHRSQADVLTLKMYRVKLNLIYII